MNLGERETGLLKLVEDYRDRECRRILEAAQEEAGQLLGRVFGKQRAFLHRRVAAERSRARDRIQAAYAARATQERRASERIDLDLLHAAWPLVRERLLACWRAPPSRQRWAETYLRRALGLLPGAAWSIRYAPQWEDRERAGMEAELAQIIGQAPSFRSDDGIAAGLIVESEGAVFDASLDGLLRDRARLDARLLALISKSRRR